MKVVLLCYDTESIKVQVAFGNVGSDLLKIKLVFVIWPSDSFEDMY